MTTKNNKAKNESLYIPYNMAREHTSALSKFPPSVIFWQEKRFIGRVSGGKLGGEGGKKKRVIASNQEVAEEQRVAQNDPPPPLSAVYYSSRIMGSKVGPQREEKGGGGPITYLHITHGVLQG